MTFEEAWEKLIKFYHRHFVSMKLTFNLNVFIESKRKFTKKFSLICQTSATGINVCWFPDVHKELTIVKNGRKVALHHLSSAKRSQKSLQLGSRKDQTYRKRQCIVVNSLKNIRFLKKHIKFFLLVLKKFNSFIRNLNFQKIK